MRNDGTVGNSGAGAVIARGIAASRVAFADPLARGALGDEPARAPQTLQNEWPGSMVEPHVAQDRGGDGRTSVDATAAPPPLWLSRAPQNWQKL
jgi:hypothetical protein